MNLTHRSAQPACESRHMCGSGVHRSGLAHLEIAWMLLGLSWNIIVQQLFDLNYTLLSSAVDYIFENDKRWQIFETLVPAHDL